MKRSFFPSRATTMTVKPERFLDCPAVNEERPLALNCDAVARAQNQDAASLQSLASTATSKPNLFGGLAANEEASIVRCTQIPGLDEPFKTRAPNAATSDDVIHFHHHALNCIGMT